MGDKIEKSLKCDKRILFSRPATVWHETFVGVNFNLQVGDFLCFAKLIFAIRTDCFFLLGINICAFRKFPDKLLIIFSILLSTYNGNPYFGKKCAVCVP